MAGFGRAGTMSTTTQKPDITTDVAVKLEDMYQVVLHNDDHNIADHVVRCLVRVFGHSTQLAVKIMLEAHEKGMAVAEVEAESQASLHKEQLQSYGLTATIEKI
jgi:ATP-dependent Clp protease adaptor protein ClpS